MNHLLAQHEARKARLQRFAEAATRYQERGRATDDVRQVLVLERPTSLPLVKTLKSRRQYETPISNIANMPIALRILHAVAAEFEVSVKQITDKGFLRRSHTLPRFVAIGLMLQLTNMSLPAIGRRLGGRDHTTVINGRSRINALLQDEAFRNRFEQIKAQLVP